MKIRNREILLDGRGDDGIKANGAQLFKELLDKLRRMEEK